MLRQISNFSKIRSEREYLEIRDIFFKSKHIIVKYVKSQR